MTTIDAEALDLAARGAFEARRQAQRAINLLQAQERSVGTSRFVSEALAAARLADDHAGAAAQALAALGATPPSGAGRRELLPLELLNTPASRRLLEALGGALEAARAVDEERGWVDPDSGPCGLSDLVGGLFVELRREVEGARGRE